MAAEKIDAPEYLSALFLYTRDFNFNHILIEVNRYKVSINLARRSAVYGNHDLFYGSGDPKQMGGVLSKINGAIEMAELEGSQQAQVETPSLTRDQQVFQFKVHEYGHGKYRLDLSV
ncbi:hypothetical protein OZX65_05375 [Leuconostocaceae bacterium ESL0723]|nr:hypothetical protein OZX65_05375 [Leuconostocaceae bacterium ESL0723]